jgi:hypothetical protein
VSGRTPAHTPKSGPLSRKILENLETTSRSGEFFWYNLKP